MPKLLYFRVIVNDRGSDVAGGAEVPIAASSIHPFLENIGAVGRGSVNKSPFIAAAKTNNNRNPDAIFSR